MARQTLGPKPWKPHPKQIETLQAVADGCSLGKAAERLGVPITMVASRLSGCYTRLGVKDPETDEEKQQHHLSQWRRYKAIKVCMDHGWWPENDVRWGEYR